MRMLDTPICAGVTCLQKRIGRKFKSNLETEDRKTVDWTTRPIWDGWGEGASISYDDIAKDLITRNLIQKIAGLICSLLYSNTYRKNSVYRTYYNFNALVVIYICLPTVGVRTFKNLRVCVRNTAKRGVYLYHSFYYFAKLFVSYYCYKCSVFRSDASSAEEWDLPSSCFQPSVQRARSELIFLHL